MRKPIFFINKGHESNYLRLLQAISPDKTDINASSYILASIGIMDDYAGLIEVIEKHYLPASIDFYAMLEALKPDIAGRALISLAANLYNSSNYANINEVFSVLDDVYQAVAYQALLLKFPSFSKDLEKSYPYNTFCH